MKQSNPWLCYPTSISIITGIPVNDLIKEIGHDGSKNINVPSNTPIPYTREGFVHAEMAWALLKYNYALVYMDAAIENWDGTKRTNYPSWQEINDNIVSHDAKSIITVRKYQYKGFGVDEIVGLHSLAWIPSKEKLIDPATGENLINKDGTTKLIYPVVGVEMLFKIK